ncbi:MAG: hypothetical protein FWF05_04665 [Oscillospiraceae bacterium]|nr:hypothetical protein [Oscillospiraceae bacterium]
MKKKSTIMIAVILAVLAVGTAVLAVLNSNASKDRRQLRSDAVFLIIHGDTEYRVTVPEIESLNPREIQANYKKDGKDAETRQYTGVPFAEVLRIKGIDASGAGTAVFAASDGYSRALPMADALNGDNCFIVLDSGDEGPFRMIMAQDQFSQRWCKLLTDVTLK